MPNKLIKQIPLADIKQIEIYMNYSKKSLSDIKKDKGCTYIFNGGLYEGFKPVCNLKVNGTIKVRDEYKVFGYAWNDGPDIKMIVIPTDWDDYKNAISCTEMIIPSYIKCDPMYYDDGIKGRRGRTAIGIKDNNLMVCVIKDGSIDAKTPEEMRDFVYTLGWESALMLDGGESSQCDLNGETLYSSDRKVNNLILVYMKDKPEPELVNPYPVPTRALTYNKTGDNVKWLQFQLNSFHKIPCSVTGVFDIETLVAVKTFQAYHNLDIDGSVGTITRTELINNIIQKNPYAMPTKTVVYGASEESIKWVQWQLTKAGYFCKCNGEFDETTESQVKAFQTAKNVAVDGSVGPITRKLLAAI